MADGQNIEMKNTGKSVAAISKVMTTQNCQQTTLNTPRIVFGDITKKHLPDEVQQKKLDSLKFSYTAA
ncbi:hypothetical protein U7537_09090 [Lacticaseibacillus rhamnosus]